MKIKRTVLALGLVLLSCAVYCAPAPGGELVPSRLDRVILVWDGRYHEVSITVVQGTGQLVFFVDGATPPPAPTPPVPPTPQPPTPFPPTPSVPPVPPGKLTTVVIIEESADRTPETARMLVDAKLLTWREMRKPAWHMVDKDVVDSTGKPPAKLRAYLDLAAKAKELPCLFLDSDSDGANGVLFSGSLPSSADKLMELLNAY